MINKISFLFYLLLFIFTFNTLECHAGLFSKNINQVVNDALKSQNPKTVDKCLDKVIKSNYLTGILKIRNHARSMLKYQRSQIIKANKISKKEIEKRLIPWVKIDKKTVEYFKRKTVDQGGKENPLYIYHQ